VAGSVHNRAVDILLLRAVLDLLRDSRRRRHSDPEGIQELPDIRDNRRGRLGHILHRLPVLVVASFSRIPRLAEPTRSASNSWPMG